MSRASHTVLLAVLLSAVVFTQTQRQWQDGTWRDTERLSTIAGVVGSGQVSGHNYTGAASVVRKRYQLFVIEGSLHIYVGEERLRWRWSKPIPMTVNAPVRFAVSNDKVWVVGEDGKEHGLSLVKKILKQTK
jgi:hypothetical protein